MSKPSNNEENSTKDQALLEDVDLSGLGVGDIDVLVAKLGRVREEKSEQRLLRAWGVFVEELEELGYEVTEALRICRRGESKNTCRVLRIKYRDPNNSKNVWAGRGKAPNWILNYEKEGRSRKEFKVK